MDPLGLNGPLKQSSAISYTRRSHNDTYILRLDRHGLVAVRRELHAPATILDAAHDRASRAVELGRREPDEHGDIYLSENSGTTYAPGGPSGLRGQ
jgi:hypothetical protein